ncbi:hypothetical protein D3C87_1675320 [compost metagenome]
MTLALDVQNRSPLGWPASASIRLSNWLLPPATVLGLIWGSTSRAMSLAVSTDCAFSVVYRTTFSARWASAWVGRAPMPPVTASILSIWRRLKAGSWIMAIPLMGR